MQNPMGGLMGTLFKDSQLDKLGIAPKLEGQTVVIEMTTEQLAKLLLAGVDEKARGNIAVEVHEGILQLKLRLM